MVVNRESLTDLDITASSITESVPPPEGTAASLIPRAAALRYEADLIRSDAMGLHHGIQAEDLDRRAISRAREDPHRLLEELYSEHGLSWTSIGRLLGVSLPAVRKWRAGGVISPPSRDRLSHLIAFVDMLSEQFMIDDPASWLEMPLAGTRFTAVDIYAAGRLNLLLDFAGSRLATPQLLGLFKTDWRGKTRSDYEVVLADDGQYSIQLKR